MNEQSINRQILSWMLIITGLTAILLSSFYLLSYDQSFKKQALKHLSQIADTKTIQIDDYIRERIRDAQLTARLSSTKEALKVLAPKFKQRLDDESAYLHLQQRYSNNLQPFLNLGYYDIFLISPSADIILTLAHENDLYSNLIHGSFAKSSLALAVNNAFSLKEPSLSHFKLYPTSNDLAAFIAIPVLEKGAILGVIAFQIDTEKLQQVVEDNNGLGTTGVSHIVTIHDQQQLFIGDSVKQTPTLQQQTSSSFGLPMLQALKGNIGSSLAIDNSGNEVLSVRRYLPFLHAGFVVKINSDEALSELNNFWKTSLFIVTLVFSFVVFIAYLLSRSITRPLSILTTISQDIAQGKHEQKIKPEGSKETQQLANSFNIMLQKSQHERQVLEHRVNQRTADLSQKEQYLALTLNSIGDAVISTDINGNITRINPIAEHLTGWSFEQAKGKNIKQVFTIVNSATKESMINPIDKVIATGEIVHLSNHTTLISKQGKEYQIADTAAPIKNKADNIILGIVLVFNDVSETYQLRMSEQSIAEQFRLSEQHLRLYREQSPIATIEWDKNCQVVDWNKAAEKIFGYSLQEVQGKNFIDLTFPKDIKQQAQNVWEHLISPKGGEISVNNNITKNGKTITCEWHNTPLKDLSGSVIGAASLILDVTERQRTEAVLQTLAENSGQGKEPIFQLIVRQLALSQNVKYALLSHLNPRNPDMVDTLAVWANGAIINNFSYSLKGTPCEQVFTQTACLYPDHIQSLFPEDTLLVDLGANSYFGVPLQSSNGKSIGILALLDDKSMEENLNTRRLLNSLSVRAATELERKKADEKLQFATRIFNETHGGITLTDTNGIIIDVNPGFSAITGYSKEEVIGRNPNILSSGLQSKQFYKDMWQSLTATGHWHGEIWNRKKTGKIYAQLMTISALVDDNQQVTNYVGLFSDITLAKDQQQELELMAHYDVLTRLPNRNLFSDRFVQAIAHSKRDKSLLAVCFLDLDEFKPVNDTYGHDVGDQVLIEVAQRIKGIIRAQDTVSRLGGDEFTLLLGDIHSIEQCTHALMRIHHAIAQPYIINDKTIFIAASSGMTIYPLDDADPDTLIRHADSAMYQAKLLGRNRYHLFDALHEQKIIKQHSQLNEIELAFSNHEFSLFYQPKVNILTGEIYGAEALIRWIHPEKGLIPPLDFLPFIEGTELEIQVGNWVVDEALKQVSQWQSQGINLQVSVNISAFHLQWKDFFKQIYNTLADYPEVSSQLLQLEILESSVLSDVSLISGIIKKCRDLLGVSIALDDFGTGYSSLTHLRRLPVNTIKIDQSFIRDMLDDPGDYAIVEGVIGLSKAFKREVIAEGVETKEHGLKLMQMGCTHLQGYGIARPMPATQIEQWLNQHQPYEDWIN